MFSCRPFGSGGPAHRLPAKSGWEWIGGRGTEVGWVFCGAMSGRRCGRFDAVPASRWSRIDPGAGDRCDDGGVQRGERAASPASAVRGCEPAGGGMAIGDFEQDDGAPGGGIGDCAEVGVRNLDLDRDGDRQCGGSGGGRGRTGIAESFRDAGRDAGSGPVVHRGGRADRHGRRDRSERCVLAPPLRSTRRRAAPHRVRGARARGGWARRRPRVRPASADRESCTRGSAGHRVDLR